MSDNADMSDFIDCGPILQWVDETQPECPDWFKMGNFYYLIYSIGGHTRYAYSMSPFGEWKEPENNIVPCGAVPKSASFNGRRIFAGYAWEGGYAGGLVICEAFQNADGTLRFKEIGKWTTDNL